MKLLIVTQAVDMEDPALGFFHRWIEEFAKHAERVEVMCLKEGKHALPANVRVHSLGKPCSAKATQGAGARIKYVFRFCTLIWRLRHEYDAVFVHMNPEYVVLGGLVWRLLGKRIGLWYVHKSVDLKLRAAVCLAHDVFTVSREGFFLTTRKLRVVGHGIDTAAFRAPIGPFHKPLRIVSAGRITPLKNLDALIDIVALLKERGIDAEATLIGAPALPSDEAYRESLKVRTKERGISDRIHFAGSAPHAQMPEQYRQFDISINLCPTGGMDKAVLESMAAGLLVFVSNRAFTDVLGPHASALIFQEKDVRACVDKIADFVHHPESAERVRADLAQWVKAMDIQTLVPRILSSL